MLFRCILLCFLCSIFNVDLIIFSCSNKRLWFIVCSFNSCWYFFNWFCVRFLWSLVLLICCFIIVICMVFNDEFLLLDLSFFNLFLVVCLFCCVFCIFDLVLFGKVCWFLMFLSMNDRFCCKVWVWLLSRFIVLFSVVWEFGMGFLLFVVFCFRCRIFRCNWFVNCGVFWIFRFSFMCFCLSLFFCFFRCFSLFFSCFNFLLSVLVLEGLGVFFVFSFNGVE